MKNQTGRNARSGTPKAVHFAASPELHSIQEDERSEVAESESSSCFPESSTAAKAGSTSCVNPVNEKAASDSSSSDNNAHSGGSSDEKENESPKEKKKRDRHGSIDGSKRHRKREQRREAVRRLSIQREDQRRMSLRDEHERRASITSSSGGMMFTQRRFSQTQDAIKPTMPSLLNKGKAGAGNKLANILKFKDVAKAVVKSKKKEAQKRLEYETSYTPSPASLLFMPPTHTSSDTAASQRFMSSMLQRKNIRMTEILEIEMRRKNRIADNVSGTSPVRQAFKQMRASRMWEKYDQSWERKKIEWGSDEEMFFSSSVSESEDEDFSLSRVPFKRNGSDLYSPDVINILHELQVAKKKRHKKNLRSQVNDIMGRVSRALQNVDMDYLDSDEEEALNLPVIYIKPQAEVKRQSKVMEDISRFSDDSEHRQQLDHEVSLWLSDPGSLAEDLIPDEEMDNIMLDFQDIHENIMEILKQFGATSEAVVKLGGMLLEEAAIIIREKREENAKKNESSNKDKSTVYDERSLLADPVKWETATKLVLQTFDDAVKWTKNSTHRYILGKTSKQFKNLATAMTKKEQELKEKRKLADELKAKMTYAKAVADKTGKEMDEVKKSLRRMSIEVEEKRNLLTQAEEKNKVLIRKLSLSEAKVKNLESEIETKIIETVIEREVEGPEDPKRPGRKKSQPPPPPPQPEIIKVVDSSTQLKLDETEKQLRQAETRVEILREKLREMERNYKAEQEKVKVLREDLDAAEKAAEEAMECMPDTNAVFEFPSDQPETQDTAYYKTLLSGLRNEFTTEVDKLKGYLRKERTRNSAAIRRVEMTHKDHLNAIQKDIIRVLRALMHFKDHVVSILEKEQLKEPAYKLKVIPSLIPEKIVPDPKELLALLVGNVVEYMHNMELTLANAFLAMRMMVKGAIEHAQAAADAVVEKQINREQRAKERRIQQEYQNKVRTVHNASMETKNLAKRLRKAKDRLVRFEEVAEMTVTDKKYMALLERYKMVWQMYNRLQKDMDVLQFDFQSTLEEKLREHEDLIVTKIRMDIRDSKKTHEKDLKISIADQKKNLSILETAYEENKISKELYTAAAAVLKKAMHIPQKRLRYLLEQYIAYRTVKETRGRVHSILKEESLTTDLRRDMINYMKRMDEKLHISMTTWQDQMKVLENERRNMFKTIWHLFSEIVAETGILLIHPLLRDEEGDKADVFNRLAVSMDKQKLQSLLNRRRGLASFNCMPAVLKGSRTLKSHSAYVKEWKPFVHEAETKSSLSDARVDTPHSQNYDVNKTKIMSLRAVKKMTGQPVYPMSNISTYSITKDLELLTS